jgi:hypothetical protein
VCHSELVQHSIAAEDATELTKDYGKRLLTKLMAQRQQAFCAVIAENEKLTGDIAARNIAAGKTRELVAAVEAWLIVTAEQMKLLMEQMTLTVSAVNTEHDMLTGEIAALRKIAAVKERELAEAVKLIGHMKADMRGKDVENERLRREVFGVEVHDVDGGVTRVVEVGEEGTEPVLARMQRDQVAGARVAEVLQVRLVEVKKEKTEAEEELEYEIEEKGYQIRATNSLQTKVDDLKALALNAGADASAIKTILDRPL